MACGPARRAPNGSGSDPARYGRGAVRRVRALSAGERRTAAPGALRAACPTGTADDGRDRRRRGIRWGESVRLVLAVSVQVYDGRRAVRRVHCRPAAPDPGICQSRAPAAATWHATGSPAIPRGRPVRYLWVLPRPPGPADVRRMPAHTGGCANPLPRPAAAPRCARRQRGRTCAAPVVAC